ncbi:MAG: hypothetical protein Q4A69_07390 [Moraxella sp.]|nr:hypothetical protein [Moraxella sp.]
MQINHLAYISIGSSDGIWCLKLASQFQRTHKQRPTCAYDRQQSALGLDVLACLNFDKKSAQVDKG